MSVLLGPQGQEQAALEASMADDASGLSGKRRSWQTEWRKGSQAPAPPSDSSAMAVHVWQAANRRKLRNIGAEPGGGRWTSTFSRTLQSLKYVASGPRPECHPTGADITVDKKKYAEVGELRKDASQPRHENVTS